MNEVIVVIDFGHGLPDPGAVKFGQEYQYAASIGREITKRLPGNIKVIYTRTTDKALDANKGKDLNVRCNVANRANADLFVSIHLNAGGGTGYETLVYSPNKEATAVHNEIKKVLDKHGLKDRGIKERTDVRVLKATNMTAMLLECLFIDNKSDMAKLNDQPFFEEFCQAIAVGICKAVGVTPQTKAAAQKEETKLEEKQVPSPFAKEPWERMTQLGVTDGSRPQDPITRQEVAVMLDRVYQLVKK